jgi:spore germination protein GerM
MKNAKKNSQASKKVRKLYHLEEEDVAFVREHATRQEISESAVIRQAVRKLQKDSGDDPFLTLVGTVDAGTGGSVRHDEIIYE